MTIFIVYLILATLLAVALFIEIDYDTRLDTEIATLKSIIANSDN